MQLYRLLTAPDEGDIFCRKVTKALNEGWLLYGSPSMAFDATTGKVTCAQAVIKEQDGVYDEAKPLSGQ